MSTTGHKTNATHILAGLVTGALLGLGAHAFFGDAPWLGALIADWIHPAGKIFLRLIFMVVIPLLVSALMLGVLELGNPRHLGRVGLRCIVVTLLLSSISVGIGIGLVNLLQPGRGLPEEKRAQLTAQYSTQAADKVAIGQADRKLSETLLNLLPANPVAEAARALTPADTGGSMLALMFFSLIFGLAMTTLPAEKSQALTDVLRALFDICMVVIGWAMRLAPFGVACLTFSAAAQLGLDVLRTLGAYAGVVVLGLGLHQFVTYSLAVRWLGGRSPVAFFRESQEAIITAFSTSSSNATLPVALRVAEEKLRLPPAISRFVLTVGVTANQNGTALYEGVTVLFLAQVFGVELTLAQQFTVALLCVLAGIGTAGVPGGSLPLVVGVLMTIGVPGESIAIILGIDRLLDMCRTALNVTGDLVCAVIVAKGEEA